MDKWLKNKNVIRLLSVFLAIMLWAVVNREEQFYSGNVVNNMKTETITNVSITQSGLDESRYYLKSVDTNKVNVVLTGLESNLRKVDPSMYKIVMDLSNLSAGEHRVRLREVGFPPGVSVEIFPRYVTVEIEELQRIEIPVSVRAVGTPKEGFVSGEPIVTPAKVHAIVPASLADQVHMAAAEVSVDQADKNVVRQVKLTLLDKTGNEMEGELNPKVVDVEIPITLPYKEVPLQVNLRNKPAEGYSIAGVNVHTEEVKVFAPEKVLDNLHVYGGVAVDVKGLTSSRTFELEIPLIEGVNAVEPNRVTVEVLVVPSETKTLENVPIVIVGQKEGTQVRFVEPESGVTDLTLEGAPELLRETGKDDVKLVADISHLLPGTHEVTLSVNLPPYIQSVGLEAKKVQIEIVSTE